MIKDVFGESIYFGKIDVETHKSIKNIINLEKENKSHSYGSWKLCEVKSTFFEDSILYNDTLVGYEEILEEEMKKHMNKINEKLNYVIEKMWYNVYNKNDFQEPHTHLGKCNKLSLSCIYCVAESDAKLYFFNPRYTTHSLSGISSVFDSDNYKEHFFPNLKEGNIIIFPSYLYHGVSPQKSDTQRITVAFNINILDE